jgi:hypothetical protein
VKRDFAQQGVADFATPVQDRFPRPGNPHRISHRLVLAHMDASLWAAERRATVAALDQASPGSNRGTLGAQVVLVKKARLRTRLGGELIRSLCKEYLGIAFLLCPSGARLALAASDPRSPVRKQVAG